jgi:hypothetical protein
MKEVEIYYQSGWMFSDTCWWRMRVRDLKSNGIKEYYSKESPKGQSSNSDGLALMMGYLHKNPKERIKIHRDSDLKKDLAKMAAIHNHCISVDKKQPLEGVPLLL